MGTTAASFQHSGPGPCVWSERRIQEGPVQSSPEMVKNEQNCPTITKKHENSSIKHKNYQTKKPIGVKIGKNFIRGFCF